MAEEKAGDVLEKKLEKSERALAIERASRSEAEKRGAASAAEAQRYKSAAEGGKMAQVQAQISGLEAERDKLKREYAQHLADGEFEKASDTQFQMSEVAAKLTSLASDKATLEETKGKEPEKAPIGTAAEQREAFINSRSPATAAWLREHSDYFTDAKLQARVTGAHNLAVGNGLTVDSQEYFEFVEKTAGMTSEEEGETEDVEKVRTKQPGKKNIPFSAPPSREATGAGPRLKAGDMHLNEAMMRGAAMAGIEATDKAGLESYYNDYVKRFRNNEISDWAQIMTRK